LLLISAREPSAFKMNPCIIDVIAKYLGNSRAHALRGQRISMGKTYNWKATVGIGAKIVVSQTPSRARLIYEVFSEETKIRRGAILGFTIAALFLLTVFPALPCPDIA